MEVTESGHRAFILINKKAMNGRSTAIKRRGVNNYREMKDLL